MEKVIRSIIKLLQTRDDRDKTNELHELFLSIPVLQKLLRNLSYPSQLNIIAGITLHEYKKNSVIYSYGEYCYFINILIHGSVLLYLSENESTVLPIKILHDPTTSRSKVYPTNAISKENTYILNINLALYNNIILSELDLNIKEKIHYLEDLIPGISLCTQAQKEKIAYCLDIFYYKKGTVLSYEGTSSDRFQIVLEGECSIFKNQSGKPRIISKLGKGSFISENTMINGNPTEETVIVSSEKAKIGKFKNTDVQNNFPAHILASIKSIHKVKKKMHDKILKFGQLTASVSLPSKSFPKASPRALANIGYIALRQRNNSSTTNIKPYYKDKLERLRDSSPTRIDKFFS
jgi:Cyclic nucleotide-binding domain